MKKERKLNNKGFTLIEVLAVIVILVIIVSIAIPNISASLDRQSCTVTENKAMLIASAAQFYVSDNRGTIKDKLDENKKCQIETSKLIETGDITADDLKDGNDEPFSGYIVYNNTDESYTFCFAAENDNCGYNDKQLDSSENEICGSTTTKCYE